VFAIPGSIHSPTSRGCHALIREGATLVESAADIFTQLQGWLPAPDGAAPVAAAVSAPALDGVEAGLWALLDFDGQALDELVLRSGLAVGEVLAGLMGLELKGLIEPRADAYVRLR
jgi:DNA processing protein